MLCSKSYPNLQMSETESNSKSRDASHSQYLACGILCLGGLVGGTVTGWSSTALPSLKSSGDFSLHPSDLSWIASIVNLGTLASAPIAGFTIRKFGRKATILLSSIPYIVGYIGLAIPTQVWMLYTGRFLTGLALGLMAISGSVYLVEIADPKLRGSLSSIWFVSIKLGILLTYVVGSYLPYDKMSAICALVAITFGVSSLFIPESPRWLMTQWKVQKAIDSMCWLRACKKSSPSLEILQEIDEIKNAVIRTENESQKLKISYYFTSKVVMKSILVSSILMIFKETGGGNVLTYYAVQIFEKTGSVLDPHLSGMIAGVSQLVALLLTTYYVDKVGRKILLTITYIIMGLSLIALGLFYQFKSEIEAAASPFSGWITMSIFVIYHAANSGGPFVLTWTVTSEVIPSNVIGFVSGFATAFGWVAAFVLARFYEDMNDSIGIANTFWFYALMCTLAVLCIQFFVPETTCKSLESIHKAEETSMDKHEES